jgi:hypothetical protein
MDPWEEHAIKNPRCFHIRLVKGAKFIREVQVREIKRLQKKALFEDLPFSATMEKTTPADDEITDNTEGLFTSHHPLHSSKKRNKITNLSLSLFFFTDMTCKICLTNKIQLVLLPCSHLCTCRECAVGIQYDECPICKASIDAYIPIYYT